MIRYFLTINTDVDGPYLHQKEANNGDWVKALDAMQVENDYLSASNQLQNMVNAHDRIVVSNDRLHTANARLVRDVEELQQRDVCRQSYMDRTVELEASVGDLSKTIEAQDRLLESKVALIAQLSAENAEWKSNVDGLREKIRYLKVAEDNTDSDITDLDRSLSLCRAELVQHEANIIAQAVSFDIERAQYGVRIDMLTDALIECEAANKALRDDVVADTQTNKNLNERLEQAVSDYWQCFNERAADHDELGRLKIDNERMIGEISKYATEWDQFRQKANVHAQLRYDHDALKERYAKLDADHARLSYSHALAETVRADNQNVVKMEGMKKSIEGLQQTIDYRNASLREMDTLLSVRDGEITTLQQVIEENNKELARLDDEIIAYQCTSAPACAAVSADSDMDGTFEVIDEVHPDTRRLINELYHDRARFEDKMKKIRGILGSINEMGGSDTKAGKHMQAGYMADLRTYITGIAGLADG